MNSNTLSELLCRVLECFSFDETVSEQKTIDDKFNENEWKIGYPVSQLRNCTNFEFWKENK